MPSLITQVKSKLFIHSSQKSMHALDGAYASLLHGRSLDFEDLRQYEYGDQIRDIDWRATARMGEPLVKRHRANRMHTILFVVDTGLSMTALAHDEKPKKDLAILTTGALGVLALRHGDDFSIVHGDAERIRRRAPGRSEGALEHGLRTIEHAIDTASAPSDRDALLAFVARTIARRCIVVIVTDEAPVTDETERMLRRLRVQHDVLWITLRDADPVLASRSHASRADVNTHWSIPDFVHGDAEVRDEIIARTQADAALRDDLLDRLEISRASLDTQDAAVTDLLRMLNRRAHVRR
ncbi:MULTISPECIES: DUF58 domain-containing protein [unclassified Microbacterium]|uniref:DUF58 domain-containing protein n=1 Tax=unclassified Microbacterium TaxID=2609290 RepID=UPI001D599285|nr:DUF58 domain-containing protein [Microbacterium sp. Bi121]CAH0210158.1 hypothetical protein SRABI121_02705 [Microbacterium sp. Bi121]